jgi:sigma-70-like protein
MTEHDRLPPDQRAVLSLVLDRGKSYAQVASLLSIPEATVRERAHAALDALAQSPPPAAPAPAQRASVAAGAPAGASVASARDRASAGGVQGPGAPAPPAAQRPPGSRRAGAALLAGLAVAVVVAVVLLAGGGGKGGGKSSAASTGAATGASASSTSTQSGVKPRVDSKLTLSPSEPESRARGEAYVLSDGSRRAFYVAARGLEPSHGFFYAVWLYNSPSSSAPLGRAPTVGSNGRLEGGGPLPANARDYGRIVVTRETDTHARQPGTIVLSGRFSLR